MINLHNPDIRFCVEAVQQASLIVRHIQSELVSPSLTKNDRSPVTVADFASQALVGRLLAETLPEDALVAEEDSAVLRQAASRDALDSVTHYVRQYVYALEGDKSEGQEQVDQDKVCSWIDTNRADSGERFWTLDPIDGTKGFLRGDQYAVALALIVGGKVQVAALGCPNLREGRAAVIGGSGSLVVAVRGEGTWVTDLNQPGKYTRLQVSNQDDPSQARLLRSFESGHTDTSKVDQFSEVMGVEAAPVLMDSQAKYAILASGGAELLLRLLSPSRPDYREKIWDQAAGSLVLEQAGGRISDLSGKELDFSTGRQLTNNRGVLASNNQLHENALRAINIIRA